MGAKPLLVPLDRFASKLSRCTARRFLALSKNVAIRKSWVPALIIMTFICSSGMGGPAIEKFITYLIENIYDDLGWADTGDHGERFVGSWKYIMKTCLTRFL